MDTKRQIETQTKRRRNTDTQTHTCTHNHKHTTLQKYIKKTVKQEHNKFFDYTYEPEDANTPSPHADSQKAGS